MAKSYDVVVAGGGHNGLTVAAYLAKAGLNVAVVEAKKYVGGGVITREVTNPGFKHDLASTGHMFIQPNPIITNDELRLLSKYGLKYIYPQTMASIIFPDDQVLKFYRDVDKTCASIEQFSHKDAAAYRRFHDWTIESLDILTAGMFSPPQPFGNLVAMLDRNEQGQEILRTLMMSAQDVANEWFESPELRIALGRFVSEGMVDPQLKGTGLNLFMFIGLIHKFGWGVPVGGSGILSDALERCLIDHGGTVLTSSNVECFDVKEGVCQGVILDTGEKILGSKAVITTFSIKQLPAMIGEENLPPGFKRKVDRLTHSSFSSLHQVLAINEAPCYKAALTREESVFVQFVPGDYENYLKVFDGYKFGDRYTESPLVICWSIVDPSRAPSGKHTLYLYHYEPYSIREGVAKWDELRQETADGILKFLQKRTTNMGPENILGRGLHSPLDCERVNKSFVKADQGHIGPDLHQVMGNRPFPGMGNYRTPVKNLYLCGCSTSPGGGVSCGSRAAVPVIMEDLGMNFNDLIA